MKGGVHILKLKEEISEKRLFTWAVQQTNSTLIMEFDLSNLTKDESIRLTCSVFESTQHLIQNL